MLGQVGPDQVLEELARGGQGAVYRARHTQLGSEVAIKVLHEPDPETRERFRREGQTLAKLRHPHLLSVFGLGDLPNGMPFMAMELVKGEDLKARVEARGLPLFAEVRELLTEVALTLHYCHERGVVHRDVKPHNVMVEEETGRVLVVDFGLVQRDRNRQTWEASAPQALTKEGASVGTPAYMPPEQVSEEFGEVGPRSDVYALGALLYFLLTGSAPFSGGSAFNVFYKVMEEPPPDARATTPSVPGPLAELCRQCMAKDPSKRPESAAAFAELLQGAFEGESPPPSGGSAHRAVAAFVLLFLAVGVGVGLVVPGALEAPTSSPTASRKSPPATPVPVPASEWRARAREAKRRGDPAEALRCLRLAAGLGEGESLHELAEALEETKDPAHETEIAALHERAAEGGHVPCMSCVGKRLLHSQPEAGLRWLQQGAERGSARAMYCLGLAHMKGIGVERDAPEAERWLQRASERGSVEALGALGSLAEGREDFQKAYALYLRAAQGGNGRSMANVGILLWRGKLGPPDVPEGQAWLRRAIESGFEPARLVLAKTLYADGKLQEARVEVQQLLAGDDAALKADADQLLARIEGRRMGSEGPGTELYERAGEAENGGDPKEALRLLRLAAEAGHAGALHDLAHWLERKRDPSLRDEVRRLHLEAAKNGSVVGMACLGGRLFESDPEVALRWLEKAAKQGNAMALYNLGVAHESGKGVGRDVVRAQSYFQQAADKGYTLAMVSLGALAYAEGRYREARQWFRRSVEEGDEVSGMARLATLLHSGKGGPRDPEEALRLFERAEALGDEGARLNLFAIYLRNGDRERAKGLYLKLKSARSPRRRAVAEKMWREAAGKGN